MSRSAFDINAQQLSLSSKIVVGLERISEAFRVLLWQYAKSIGLSPIQIQILIFTSYHKEELCCVSHLAKEFNVTKPTISDAVKSLDQKKLIRKTFSKTDSRSYTVTLSAKGKKIVDETEGFAFPIQTEVDKLEEPQLVNLYSTLNDLIYKLNQSGILSVQRTCHACRFLENKKSGPYCNYLKLPLKSEDIRLDCPEFEGK